jgi:hypothetical protein
MRYEASYNGRVIDVVADNEEQAMSKAIHWFQAIRGLVSVWPKRTTPVPPVSSKKNRHV